MNFEDCYNGRVSWIQIIFKEVFRWKHGHLLVRVEVICLQTLYYPKLVQSMEKQMELRRMLVDNYSVFYTICADKVIVTDVLYTASDIEARLCGV